MSIVPGPRLPAFQGETGIPVEVVKDPSCPRDSGLEPVQQAEKKDDGQDPDTQEGRREQHATNQPAVVAHFNSGSKPQGLERLEIDPVPEIVWMIDVVSEQVLRLLCAPQRFASY